MIYKIYLIVAAIFVAFSIYLSSINKDTIFIGTGDSGFEISAVLLVFIAFLSGFLITYLISAAKKTRSYIEKLKDKKDRKSMEKAEKLLAEGKKAFLLGNSSEGEVILRDCISIPFKNSEPYIKLIDFYLDEGEYEKSFEILDKMPPNFNNEIEVLFYKAKALLARESFDRAIDVLSDLDSNENTIETKRLLRDAYVLAGLWEKASEVHAKILKMPGKGIAEKESATTARIGYEMVRKTLQDGKESESIKKLKDLVKKSPDTVKPYVSLGKLYWEKGDKKLAQETWARGYENSANLIFIFLLEDFYLKDGEPQKIIETYKNLIIKTPENPFLYLFLGKLYLRLEMMDEAVESLIKAKEIDPELPYIDKMMGEAYFRKGEFKEAANKFKEALGFKRRILIPLVCKVCGTETNEWDGACPSCGAWESLHVATEMRDKTDK